MATNNILPFAGTDIGSNLLTDAEYAADAQRATGHQTGAARRKLANKALRQATAIAAGVAQYIASRQSANITDALTASQVAGYLADATDVYTPAGPGAVATTGQVKFRERKTDADFGSIGDNSADDTVALKKLFDYCIPLGAVAILTKPAYKVSGPISTFVGIASGSLHIHCDGDVQINVAAGSTAFRHLLFCSSAAGQSSSITGGSLRIDLNDIGAEGITIRHTAATQIGTVNFTAQVTVLNCKQNDNTEINENAGIEITGDYALISLNAPVVKNVTRTNTTGGSCSGITVQGFSGEAVLTMPHAENILTGNGSAGIDADGIKIFGKGNTGTTRTSGKATLYAPVFVDCQGRSFKSQCSDVTIVRPRVVRQMVVAIASSYDFDFQKGNGLLVEPDYEYKLNGATSPIPATWRCVGFQQNLTDAVMVGKSVGGSIKTEVAINGYAYCSLASTALASTTEVSGLRVIHSGPFTGDVFTRAILEFNGAAAVAKATETKLIVRDVEGPIGCYGVAYDSYVSGDLSAKLSVEVTNVQNTQAVDSYAFRELAGSLIIAVKSLILRDNVNLRDLMPSGWAFNFATLPAGTRFSVDLATVVATNAPAWPATGYALVESLNMMFSTASRRVRVTVDDGDEVYYSGSSATTWKTIGNGIPAWSAANIASAVHVVNTKYKKQGRVVLDTTNWRLMVASGITAVSPWYVADGSASVTPS